MGGTDEGGTLDGALDGGALEGGTELGAEAGGAPVPIAVVMGPFSMKTPEKYQFSATASLTMRRTPTWKSSEFVEVAAAMFCTTFTSGFEPVDAQRPTVFALNCTGGA